MNDLMNDSIIRGMKLYQIKELQILIERLKDKDFDVIFVDPELEYKKSNNNTL